MRTSVKASLAAAVILALALTAALIGVGSGSASPINPQPPVPIAVPSLTGLQVGQTLTATPGTWAGGTPMTFLYFWLRSSGSGWSQIPTASGPTYTLTDADIGHNLFVQVKATNEDGYQLASSATTSLVTGATASDTQTLPDGTTSVSVDNVTLPDRLVVQSATFSPTTIKPGGTVTARIVVFDALNHPVRGALVQVIPLPYGSVTRPAEVATGADGSASVTLTATSQLARAGKLVGLCIQARKNGDNVLTGVTGMRLVNLSVKG
ncbi:MAG: hypothetical protein ABSB24_04155 [Gaiellaceae bacterium]|jgi:hypothetical protein